MSVSPQRIRESRDKALGILKELSGLVQEVAKLDLTETGVATRSACLSVFASRVKFVAGELGRLETCLTTDFTEAIQRSNLDANRTTIGLPPDNDTMHHWCLPVGKQFLKWFQYHVFQHVEPFRQAMTVGSLFTETTWKDLALQVNLLDGDTLQGLASDLRGDVDNAWLKDAPAYRTLRDAINAEALTAIDEADRVTEPITKNKTNGAPIDLDFARRAAAKSQAKRDEEAKRFENGQQFQRVLDRYNIAWNAWSGTWQNIMLSRAGNLAGEAGEEDLAAALNGLVEVVRDRGFIDNLPIAVERFDPSYCDGTKDEEESYAVKILLDALNAVAGGTDAGEVAEALLTIEPLPLLFHAESARRLLRVADHWPNHCEHCGRIQPPDSFDNNRCPDCSSTEGTLVALFNCIRRVDADPSKQESSTDRLFPFWGGWRMQLQSAFPGANGDLAIMHKWIEYLTNTKGMQRHAWQFIKFADAASIIPQAATTGMVEPEPEPDSPSTETVSAKPNTKGAKPEKVCDIAADKLLTYLTAGRLHLKWIEKKRPKGDRLQWFFDEVEFEDGVPAWEKLRSTSRRTANRYGFNVAATQKWVKALENDIKRRRKAGILVPGTEDWD